MKRERGCEQGNYTYILHRTRRFVSEIGLIGWQSPYIMKHKNFSEGRSYSGEEKGPVSSAAVGAAVDADTVAEDTCAV